MNKDEDSFGVQALGNVLGPALQLGFTSLEHPGICIFGDLTFSFYTAPGFLACGEHVIAAKAN